jgi:serine/threonine protein kinase
VTLEGDTFDGYRLLRLLGRGGAGEVYLADSPADGPVAGQVAIKLYHAARNEPVGLELMRQTQMAAALRHPHILPCYNNAVQGKDLGIVMEFAHGGSLGDTLNAIDSSVSLPLAPDAAASIIAQVARTLADVHANGLAHGDLKPTNLFVRNTANGAPVIAISDFGHAYLARAALASLRQPGADQPPEWAVAQLAWAAPEQLRGALTPASDQYSLAALAYYLLTGIRPVSAEAQSALNGRSPRPIGPPSRLNPALDDKVDAVLLHALAPVPELRFGDIMDFARALDDAVATDDVNVGRANRASRASSARMPARPRGASLATDETDRPTKRTLAQMSYTAPRPRVRRPASAPMVLDDADLSDGADTPSSSRRRSAVVAALLFVGALSILILASGAGKLPVHLDLPGFAGAHDAPTAQSSPSPETSTQSQAEARLRAALGSKPTYSDALTGAPATWAVSGTAIFFGADQHLHLNNTAKTPLFANIPASATLPHGAYVATVDVALIKGKTTDHAGMRFLVSTSDKGATYYSYLVTPDGRFEVWLQQPSTGLVFLTSGSVPSLNVGLGKANTIAVLVDPTANTLTLFVNGGFIYQAPISGGVAMTGRLGVLTPDSGVEATFANFAVYGA